ncbi:site-2 protease family protein [Bacillus sp. FJAT-47783]|uniref:site-2 protease family protein n=1 Tax=Bacillus sp. FJAT-47783 TaxID=2922712 RepID=UPI001FADFAE1|nr:site-2 protease family protein [Bacillus sp. FJAT-47783]
MEDVPLPFLHYDLSVIPYVIISLVIAFTFHEFAHAYVAYKFGDETAKNQGRLTLNPLSHLDPLGTILIFIAGFGWARPVPVNRFFFKNPRLAGILVSIAGPLSNLLIAFVGYVMLHLLIRNGSLLPFAYANGLEMFLNILVSLNITLFIFNLLPFPPLDGYRIIEDLAPRQIRAKLTQFENYGALIFLIIVFTPLDQYLIYPVFHVGRDATILLFQAILQPFFI